jgi:excisionase family DNA binding protein
MTNTSFNINEAAKKLNVSTRTVRRYIKAGKLKAELVKGSFGEEYRILELPPQLDPNVTMDNEKAAGKTSVHPSSESFDMIRELQEKNLALAAQLGAAAERIRNLEGQVKLLDAPKTVHRTQEPWWDRVKGLFVRRRDDQN